MAKRPTDRTDVHIEPEFVEIDEEELMPDQFVLERITSWVTALGKVGVTPDKAADIASEFFFAAFANSLSAAESSELWDDHEDCEECDE